MTAPALSFPYALTPRPPVYFVLRDGKYTPATREFRTELLSRRAALGAKGNEMSSTALVQFIAFSVLLADWATEKSAFDAHPNAATLDEVARHLDERLK